MIIVKEFTFHAAHFLPGHPTCGTMHGHTYKVQVGVSGPINIDTGMVLDFKELKELYKVALNTVDHRTLNKVLPSGFLPPTAENIALYIVRSVQQALSRLGLHGIQLELVKVWETPTSHALWVSSTFSVVS